MTRLMQAQKLFLETDQHGHLKQPLHLLPNKRFEAIFLVLDGANKPIVRKPSNKIAGQGKILGDIMQPAVPVEDWNMRK